MSLLIDKSWVVFIYAVTISVESIVIEYLTGTLLKISSILLSAISITLAGVLLSIVALFVLKKRGIPLLLRKSWKNLFFASSSMSIGIFTWYDSITRIGASKEVLIAGPLEIVIIVFLARLFLNERLHKFHVIGVCMALIGFSLAIVSDINIENIFDTDQITSTSLFSIKKMVTFGDIEAILSALGFAIGVLFLTDLVSKFSPIEVAGTSMFLAGLILVIIMFSGVLNESQNELLNQTISQQLSTNNVLGILLFSLLPFLGSLSYSTGLSRIGASLTATIGSSSILITLIIQIILRELGFFSHLPENILLAILGGVIGFFGIYMIHLQDYSRVRLNKSRHRKNFLE